MSDKVMVDLYDVLKALETLQDEFAGAALRNNMSFTYYDTLATGVEAAKTRLVIKFDPDNYDNGRR